jgi:hypothetical protein
MAGRCRRPPWLRLPLPAGTRCRIRLRRGQADTADRSVDRSRRTGRLPRGVEPLQAGQLEGAHRALRCRSILRCVRPATGGASPGSASHGKSDRYWRCERAGRALAREPVARTSDQLRQWPLPLRRRRIRRSVRRDSGRRKPARATRRCGFAPSPGRAPGERSVAECRLPPRKRSARRDAARRRRLASGRTTNAAVHAASDGSPRSGHARRLDD